MWKKIASLVLVVAVTAVLPALSGCGPKVEVEKRTETNVKVEQTRHQEIVVE